MLPGIIGSLQAMEAIKLLAGIGRPPIGRLVHYRALDTSFREIKIKKDPNCPLCGENATIKEPVSYTKPSCSMSPVPEISTLELRKILAEGFEGILLDVRDSVLIEIPTRYAPTIEHIHNAIVVGIFGSIPNTITVKVPAQLIGQE